METIKRFALRLGRARLLQARSNAVSAHWTIDVLKLLLTNILRDHIQLALQILLHPAGDADATRGGKSLEPRRNIDPVSEDVPVVDDDVPLMDADAEQNLSIRWYISLRSAIPF